MVVAECATTSAGGGLGSDLMAVTIPLNLSGHTLALLSEGVAA